MEYWDQKNECMSRDEIRQLQLEKLQATLHRVYKNVRHYRKIFREKDFMPEDMGSFSDFKRLPLINRRDLSENYPYDMFAVPLREVVRLHTASIHFEDPIVIGFTRNDIDQWAELMARNFTAVGVNRDDVVQIAMNFGITTGPFGVQVGAEKIGASVIPMSSGKLPAQVKIMRDFRTTVLVSTPTLAVSLVRQMEEMNLDPRSLSLKYGVFGCEPWSETMRSEIETKMHIIATDTYGMTELFGPGVAWECPEKNGLHIAEDHFIPEIIDPVTLKSLPPGQMGELVLTSISKEAFPLIRFRTGDISSIDYGPCGCGRTHCRISRIFKRSDDVMVVRGMSITPQQVAQVLSRVSGGEPVFQVKVERLDGLDQLTVMLEISNLNFFDQMKKQRLFVEQLHRELSELVGWEVAVKLVEPGTFDPGQKVLDTRCFQ
ncbi:MAG: phenylacetate--CoA ligase [Desulfosalsimonadaceae bacterium]